MNEAATAISVLDKFDGPVITLALLVIFGLGWICRTLWRQNVDLNSKVLDALIANTSALATDTEATRSLKNAIDSLKDSVEARDR